MTTRQQAIREKEAVARSRNAITGRLGLVPVGCHKCTFVKRCEVLAPSDEVICELSDADAGIGAPLVYDTTPRDWYDEEYYLRVHVLTGNSYSRCE